MKYKTSVYCFESPDARTHLFRFVDHKTGRMAEGMINAGESNVTAAFHPLGIDYTNTLYVLVPAASARQFKYQSEQMPYISCSPACIALYVRLAFKLEKKKFRVASGFALNTIQLAELYSEREAVDVCLFIRSKYKQEITLKQAAALLAFLEKVRG